MHSGVPSSIVLAVLSTTLVVSQMLVGCANDVAATNLDATTNVTDAALADATGTGVDANVQEAELCMPLPLVCNGASPATSEHVLVTADQCSFGLTPWSSSAINKRQVLNDALVAASSGLVTVPQILGDLNRQGIVGITQNNADRLTNHAWRGFRWNSGDNGVSYWYPQGITGSSDAYPDGQVGGRDIIMASWYHKTEDRPTKGVRISVADVTDIAAVDYRHMLLVEATGMPDNPNFKPVETTSGDALHAGGIAWWGRYLYVVDTTGGLRVFDLDRIMRVTNTDDTSLIGISAGRFDAHGYGYIVPELMRYQLAADSCDLRFSFVGVDRSSSPPALITGEYKSDEITGRIVVWDIDSNTGLLTARSDTVRPSAAYVSGQTKMQGATRLDGNLYISSSSQAGSFGRLYRTRPDFGESSISAWVYGAEDLYVERSRNMIWTAAEHPDNRDIVGIPIRLPEVP